VNVNAIVSTLVLGVTLSNPASAQSQNLSLTNCIVDEVQVLPNRVHVRCGPGSYPNFPRYFASPISNSAEATRLATLGTFAMMGAGYLGNFNQGNLLIWHDPSDNGAASYGCEVNDCRRPVQIQVLKPSKS
jgi:hypothetical protein